MGTTRTKVTYKCDCGIDYGDCGRKNVLLLESCHTVDTYKITSIRHFGEEDEHIQTLGYFGDNTFDALVKIIEDDNTEYWEKEDFEKISKVNA